MNERERILELVKKGVLTSEEALVLIENLSKAQADTTAASTETPAAKAPATDDSATDDTDDATSADATSSQTKQAEDARIAAINTQIAEVTGSLDALIAQKQQIERQIAANDEQIIVLDTMDDLDTLTPEKRTERGHLQQENAALNIQLGQVKHQQADLKTDLAALQRQKRQLNKQHFTDKLFADDWQDQAKGTLNDIGKTVGDATTQISSLVKQTIGGVMDNIDWKDVTVRVPGLATEKFDHTFTYDSAATVLDIKVANGDVTLATWDQPGIQVQANIKLYGKMAEDTPLDAFIARSKIDVNDDHFVFQVPNRRVQADLVISLPKRDYDHTTVRLLNGGVTIKDLTGKDFYIKSTNGELQFTELTATMLETEGVNGSIKVVGGTIHDLMLQTMNGDIKVKTDPTTLDLQTVNGTIRASLVSDFNALTASSVNGNVKVALPASVAVNGEAKTRFGSVKSRMTGVEIAKAAKRVTLARPGTGAGVVNVTTTSGTIQLKDTDLED